MSALTFRADPPGVRLDDLRTVGQCDAVLNDMTAAIPLIERQLKSVGPGSVNAPPDWRVRAEHALRAKRLELPRIQQRRAELAKQARAEAHSAALAEQQRLRATRERLVLDVILETAPDVHSRAVAIARTRHPGAFDVSPKGAA